MRAVILAVGTELLGTDRLDSNSLRLTAALERHGVELRWKAVVGDIEPAIVAALGRALADAELVLVSGGLGPTSDDVTREATAAAVGRGLRSDPEVMATIARRFERMGLPMADSNRRQALIVEGAVALRNARGTAPGQRIDLDQRTIFLFPGVPQELDGLIADALLPWLGERCGAVARETVTLRVAGVPESEVEERVKPAYPEFGRESITILASVADVRVRATAEGPPAERHERLARMTERLADLLGDGLYSRREEDDLETVVGRLLRGLGRTVATAESCTGGLVAERLTRVAGSSDYFLGGAVAYSNAAKEAVLEVAPELLAEHGAVSEPVAAALASGARRRFGSDYAVGVTGIAGPGGGTPEKPVGTVHVAVAGPLATEHRRLRIPGDRERVRQYTSQVALEMLRRRLLADGAREAS